MDFSTHPFTAFYTFMFTQDNCTLTRSLVDCHSQARGNVMEMFSGMFTTLSKCSVECLSYTNPVQLNPFQLFTELFTQHKFSATATCLDVQWTTYHSQVQCKSSCLDVQQGVYHTLSPGQLRLIQMFNGVFPTHTHTHTYMSRATANPVKL